MSKTTKWYNWVGDDTWDEYCKTAWLAVFVPCGLILIIIVVAVIKGLMS